MLLHIRHNIAREVRQELIRRPRREARRGRVPGRHHHHHRLRFLRGDQIVEDEIRPAHRRPRIIVVPRPMQQIEHRVLLTSTHLVTRRRIHMHAAHPSIQCGGLVVNRRHRAMRHIRRHVHPTRARHDHNARIVAHALADCRIPRIHRPHAVHRERIAIRACIHLSGPRPHTVLRLGHLHFSSVLELALQAHQFSFRRI